MDWIDGHFVTGIWAGVASVALGGLLMLGSLRALRRLALRRWLRLRLESYEAQDKEWHDEYRSEPRPESSYHIWHRSQGIRGACLCMDCNPRPQSPPQSEPTTGLTSGQSARLSANLAFHRRKQAQPENED